MNEIIKPSGIIVPNRKIIIPDDNFREQLLKKYRFVYKVVHHDKDGNHMWTDISHNLVVAQGLQNSIDTCLLGVAPETDFFFVPTTGSPTFAAGDTPASHAGWTENEDYDETERQTWVGVRSGQSVGNSASPAVITVTTGSTYGGSALISSDVKGGAAGLMFSGVVASQGNQVLGAAGTLTMTYTITSADDGS